MPTTATAIKTSLLRVMSGRGPVVFDALTSSKRCRFPFFADIRDVWRPVHQAIMHVSCREVEFCERPFPESTDRDRACRAVNGRGTLRAGSPAAASGRSARLRC